MATSVCTQIVCTLQNEAEMPNDDLINDMEYLYLYWRCIFVTRGEKIMELV